MLNLFKAVLMGVTVLAGVFGIVRSASASTVEVEQIYLYRSGSLIFDDAMDNGNPLTGPLFLNGTSNGIPASYTVRSLLNASDLNSAVTEVGGRLQMHPEYAIDSSNAANTGSSNSLGVRLQTNIAANTSFGLNQYTSFSANALFAYQAPATGYGYGVRLTDGYSNGSDNVDLRIFNNGAGSYIYFRHQDFLAATITDYASMMLPSILPAGTSYITLGLGQEVAGSGLVNGFYGFNDAQGHLLDGIHTIGQTTIFHGEDHTQFELRALAPVPEPETYTLLLAGLGLMGAVARRRKNQQA